MKTSIKQISIIGLLSLVFAISCSKEETVPSIDADLVPFFEKFVNEGSTRGVIVDFEAAGVGGQLIDISEQGVVGKCLKYSNGTRVVTIEVMTWNGYSDLEKEFLIFHELGHCFLDREHTDKADVNGNCVSIMHSSSQACVNNYSNSRDQYLDELFR